MLAGYGVVTRKKLFKGQFIGQYKGRKIKKEAGAAKENQNIEEGVHSYLFVLDDEWW